MKYEIEIRNVEPMRVAYMYYKGLGRDASKVFPNVFKAIRGRPTGHPFFVTIKWILKRI